MIRLHPAIVALGLPWAAGQAIASTPAHYGYAPQRAYAPWAPYVRPPVPSVPTGAYRYPAHPYRAWPRPEGAWGARPYAGYPATAPPAPTLGTTRSARRDQGQAAPPVETVPPSPSITAKAGTVSPHGLRQGRARTTLKPGAPARARSATARPGTTGIDPAEGTADLSALGSTPASPPRRLPENFADISDSEERKARFLTLLRPLILAENERLYRQRQRLAHLLTRLDQGQAPDDEEQRWLRELALDYQVSGDPMAMAEARAALRRRVDVIPAALALAQAANESAWGQSRFAREGQNLFGIWTYDESKGMVPKRRAAGKQHLVRRFADLGEAVRFYMHNLNSHPAYRELRAKRAELRAQGKPLRGLDLAQGLERYSAKGPTYIRLIRQMIVENDLESFNGIRSSQG